MVIILKTALGLLTSLFGFYYLTDAYKSRKAFSPAPWAGLLGTGFVTNMLASPRRRRSSSSSSSWTTGSSLAL